MPGLPLAVPLQLDVLVANRAVLSRDAFRWWQFNYQALNHWHSPQPTAFDRDEGGPGEGVHLSWTLPAALRHSPADAQGDYPLVPNRWLIVRMSGILPRTATAWVVESDCPLTSGAPVVGFGSTGPDERWWRPATDPGYTSQYLVDPTLIRAWQASSDPVRSATTLDASADSAQVARLGVSFTLADWSERAADVAPFLTAMAPGNPLFTGYLAHHAGVFSFHDPLTGIDQDTLSYCVLGWYSDPAQDILAPATDAAAFTGLLTKLGWALPDGITATADTATNWSVYHAASFRVAWDRQGAPPDNDPLQTIRDSGEVNVGVGNTAADAFTSLVSDRLHDPAAVRLLRALQDDLLPQLNEPGGDALLDRAIRDTWYQPTPGGYSWTITDTTSESGVQAPLTAAEESWLTQLNRDQATLDAALATLNSLQQQVHQLWFKRGHLSASVNTWPTPPTGVGDLTTFLGTLNPELDPAHSGSAAARLIAQFTTVQGLLARVPRPDPASTDPQRALQEGIAAFAKSKGLSGGKVLKPVNGARYWQGNNPTVVLSGVDAPPAATPQDAPLTVRPYSSLITAVRPANSTLVTASAVSRLLPSADALKQLPTGAVQPLLEEFLLLDPASATAVGQAAGVSPTRVATALVGHPADRFTGTLPHIPLTDWKQPWAPLLLEWSGTYTRIPFTDGATRNWVFDGTDYRLTSVPSTAVEQRTVEGISPLSPHTSTLFRTRLDSFVRQFGDNSDLARLDDLIAKTYEWKFLAQELTGFHQILALRDHRPFRRPTPTEKLGSLPLAALLGYPDVPAPTGPALPAPAQGRVDSAPLLPSGPPLPFHGAVHGGFHFTDLRIYDAFGRVLDVIESGPYSGVLDETNFPLRLDPALTPDRTIDPVIASVIQLPPRLLQHARLDIRLLDAHDDRKVYGHDPGVTPIAGWILPNHLDRGLLLFAPDGTALGEYRLITQSDGTRRGQWSPPPHTQLTLDNVQHLAPRVHDMIGAPGLATESGFDAFLSVIDATLWSTDPLGNRADTHLSVLIGRPLALLRTRLAFQLDGDPITDTGWSATTGGDTTPDVLSQSFAIRLGDLTTHQDGVLGYFTGTDYTVFHSTAAPPATAPPPLVSPTTVTPPAAPVSATQNYVRVIGPVGATSGTEDYLRLTFTPDDHQDVTVLADPRAAIHATTGILPVTRLDIPQPYVETALASMEIAFRTGPLLTSVGPAPAGGTTGESPGQAITYPTPAEQNGTWSWWEPGPVGTWTGYDLVKTATSGTTPQRNTLREGFLQFIATPGDDTAPQTPGNDTTPQTPGTVTDPDKVTPPPDNGSEEVTPPPFTRPDTVTPPPVTGPGPQTPP
ncbi:hypothetical protein ACFVIM_03430 [Streptomyces sp. NPDC057638]|uniref:hypothetical protein n=1 Tax=Streptomyces sp. NPDC057638 TaxID=3346190 RepID=UPI00369012BA